CLGFLTLIGLGTLLLMLPFATSDGHWNNFLVALFTSTSAVCVTGLAVVDTGSYFSFWGQLSILFLIQIGGLGYMMTTTFLMLLLGRKFDLRQKFAIQESFDRPFLQGSSNLVRSIIATTLIGELTGIILMFRLFAEQYGNAQGLWMAIFHSISAWNNAGFSLLSDSLVAYRASILINLVISALVILGGIGYQVIIEFYWWLVNKLQRKRELFVFSLNFKVVVSTTVLLLLLGFIAFFSAELRNQQTLGGLALPDKLLAAWFQSMTTRTAGFNTIDLGQMTTAGLFITMAFMFVGASPSGTGGGTKTTTIAILASTTRAVLQGKEKVIIYEREVPFPLILKALAVISASIATIVLGTIIITWIDTDFNFIQILFEVMSAFATVGLSTGITASLSTIAKLIIILTMYTGRVGIILLMAAIIGESHPSLINYPKENLLVG
ncbi:MAG: ATPase, partial [Cyanobacteria bacterium J083]